MCGHACPNHHRGVRGVTLCCTYCSCRQNIDVSKIIEHLAECHNVVVELPQRPSFPPRPIPVREPVPAYA